MKNKDLKPVIPTEDKKLKESGESLSFLDSQTGYYNTRAKLEDVMEKHRLMREFSEYDELIH